MSSRRCESAEEACGFVVGSDPPAEDATRVEFDFGVLFRTHCAYVARIALTIMGDDDEIDDLIQDVFLLAHRKVHHLREAKALKGWLATITVREARRHLRRRKLRALLGLGRDLPSWTDETVDDAAGAPDQRMMVRTLERSLAALPVNERIAWTLRVEGRSVDEVSQMCECSLATAKRRIAAAQAKLEGVLHG